jgi:hypothetical protein
MEHSDIVILEYYMKGFKDELRGTSTVMPDSSVLQIAYRLGAEHAIIGDDVQSLDLLTNEEILKMIKNS